jgi:hypothetical protein
VRAGVTGSRAVIALEPAWANAFRRSIANRTLSFAPVTPRSPRRLE